MTRESFTYYCQVSANQCFSAKFYTIQSCLWILKSTSHGHFFTGDWPVSRHFRPALLVSMFCNSTSISMFYLLPNLIILYFSWLYRNDCCKVKFHLVDLAGSERCKRTQAEGDRFKEGKDYFEPGSSTCNIQSKCHLSPRPLLPNFVVRFQNLPSYWQKLPKNCKLKKGNCSRFFNLALIHEQ